MKYLSLHSAERVASVLVVAAVFGVVRDQHAWLAIVISTALGHYLLSVVYAGKQIAQVCSRPSSLALFAGLALAGVTLYWMYFPLIILFGIHHVFNEVYLLNRTLKLRNERDAAMLRASSILLNIFLYFATVRRYPELRFLQHAHGLLFVGAAVGCVLFLVALARVKRGLTASQVVDCCIFEVVGLVLLAVSFYHPINVYHVVFYHIVFWGVYPLQKMARQGPWEVPRYLGCNAVAIALGFLISPVSFAAFRLTDGQWDSLFRLTSMLHIMMSFGLSTAHPAWITRWFQGRGGALAKPPGAVQA